MTCDRIILRPIRGCILTLKQLRRRDRRVSPASQAATINRANQIVAKVLENTRREFGGAGWAGHSVVDIVLVWGGWQQLIAKAKIVGGVDRNQLTTKICTDNLLIKLSKQTFHQYFRFNISVFWTDDDAN